MVKSARTEEVRETHLSSWSRPVSHSTSFSETVERLIRQFLTATSPDPLGLREIVSLSNALPLYLDIGGCYSVRPSGEIISFEWDTEDEVQVETRPLIRNLALCQGSKKYPELREFIPSKPVDAVECPQCRGKGELPAPLNRVICSCGGVGWLH